MKEKVNKYISSIDYIVYVLSHATIMQLFWSQLSANDVLPHVLIIYYYYYYYEIIYDIQFKYLDDLILWHMAQWKYVMLHKNQVGKYLGRYIIKVLQTYATYEPTYLGKKNR